MSDAQRQVYVIVDDDEDDRLLAKLALKQVHRQLPILEFQDGQALLDYLSEASADQLQETTRWLIILDINMPRMNGFDTIQALRANPAWRSLPIVVLSTSDDKQARQKALEQGANAYATKPDSVNDLARLFDTEFASWIVH